MTSVQLREAKGKLQKSRDAVAQVFKEAKSEVDGKSVVDFTQVKCLDVPEGAGKSIAVAEKVDQMTQEMNKHADDVQTLQKAEKAAGDLKLVDAQGKRVTHPGGSGSSDEGKKEFKSLGQQFVESEIYLKGWAKGNKARKMELNDVGLDEIKTLMTTTAGWAPESLRIGRVIEDAQRPIQVTDLFPSGQTSMAAIPFMEETTFTNSAAEAAEAGTYAESALALTEQSAAIRKIATFLPVTDEQLDDVAAVQSYIDNRLRFMIRQRLDSQLLVGDGIAPNIDGILNVAGIQTQALAADTVLDAFYKAIDLVRVTGRAQPNAAIIHPTDFQPVRLLRTADGVYIWGQPQEAGPLRMWGLDVVVSDAITLGTGLVGDFANFSQLWERKGLEVKISDSHSTFFVEGKQAIRADMRVGLAVYRPAAFCEVTGI